MNGQNKDEAFHEACKNHSVRSDRELYRICPSKLSKRELEDLYFTVVEDNQELKKAINSQQNKIKVLSTKVQRMTASQKNMIGKSTKECCAYTKALVNEQKESISELKKANANLNDRIRVLNMRLCSAKQFLRRNPGGNTTRCPKCNCTPAMSGKNSSMSVLHLKRSDTHIRSAGVSNQCLDKEVQSTRTVETEVDEGEKENPENVCDENKCRTQMEELKQKIVDLQEELSKAHEEYSARISDLEQEVRRLSRGNQESRAHRLEYEARAQELLGRLRDAEALYNDLATELSIEKKKVTELETRVKTIDMSHMIANAIEQRLSKTKKTKQGSEKEPSVPMILEPPAESPFTSPRWDQSSQVETSGSPLLPHRLSTSPDKKRSSKQSDDSGYTDHYRSPDTPNFVSDKNKQLLIRISALQEELQLLKATAVSSPHESDGAAGPSRTKNSIIYEDPPPQEAAAEESNVNVVFSAPRSSMTFAKKKEKTKIAFSSDELNSSDAENEIYKRNRHSPGQSQQEVAATAGNMDASLMDNAAQRFKLYSEVIEDNKRLSVKISNEGGPQEIVPEVQKQMSSTQKTDTTSESDVNKHKRDDKRNKRDSHNSYQIPGPMPNNSLELISKPRKSSKFKQFLEGKYKGKDGKKKKDMSAGTTALQSDAEQDTSEKNHLEDTMVESYNKLHEYASRFNNDMRKPKFVKASVDSCLVTNDNKVTDSKLTLSDADKEDNRPSAINMLFMQSQTEETNAMPEVVESMNTEGRFELCSQYARACSCSRGARAGRGVQLFRTCSGTLRFNTTTTDARLPQLRRCACATDDVENDTQDALIMPSYGIQTETPPMPYEDNVNKYRRQSLTYTKSGVTSPDNTDHEISTLTDLPSEKDVKTPRSSISPGEDKATATYTDTTTSPTTTEMEHLSDGELPPAAARRDKTLSSGETKVNFTDRKQVAQRASCRMEEALQAIGDELARCRRLLQTRRPAEVRTLEITQLTLTADAV